MEIRRRKGDSEGTTRLVHAKEVRKDRVGGYGRKLGVEEEKNDNDADKILNQATLDIQSRRKMILDGLIYQDGESEQNREENIQKLEDILHSKDRIYGNSANLSPLPQQHQRSSPHRKRISSHNSKSSAFTPKWDDYDIMRHRWHYVHPKTKRLINDDPYQIPHTPGSATVTIKTATETNYVIGNYFDAENFTARTTSRSNTQRSLGDK